MVKLCVTERMRRFSPLKVSRDQNPALQSHGHQLRNTELLIGATTQTHPEPGSDSQLLEPAVYLFQTI